ncbi:MAG: tetratricopeptide repeat protein [Bdellovibrionales bacterium]|nr:tetratricopeptide repeat protein [Bdellovibrionales bacterium]NQZ19546.1 tetratricopeptide repeat protein [Bdellovibrionales bacterium]
MMKKIALTILSVFLFHSVASANSQEIPVSIEEEIQKQLDNPYLLVAKKNSKRKSKKAGTDLLSKAKRLAVDKKYEESSKLFSLTRSSRYRKDKSQIKYILGLMLMEMGLYQVASFVFYDVINAEARAGRTTRYLRQSLSKLSFLSNALDSDVLLKYTISKIRVKDFPKDKKDLFYYRLGELRLKERRFKQAAKIFGRVDPQSPVYPKALYKQGLAYSEAKQGGKALSAFDELYNISKNKGVTNTNRVNALLSMARVYYQNKKWEKAIEYYRNIPRDTWQWHDSLFEQSWAMLRSGRYFRSALSNFHTLHSTYYEDKYAPESLLLRGMVYLFICRYDEMDKVLSLFDRVYKPVSSKIKRFTSSASTKSYLDEIIKGEANYQMNRKKKQSKYNTRLPKIVLNEVITQPNIRRNLNYIAALEREKTMMSQLSTSWRASGIGKYAKRVVDKRVRSTKSVIGKQARNQLRRMKSELRDFFEQSDFLKFEMISGKKESLRKQIAGKGLKKQITDKESRDFFIGNGFEYWPYQGEYWLDELGNYHYVGVQACE